MRAPLGSVANVNTEMLEKHGINAMQEFVDPSLPNDGNGMSCSTRVSQVQFGVSPNCRRVIKSQDKPSSIVGRLKGFGRDVRNDPRDAGATVAYHTFTNSLANFSGSSLPKQNRFPFFSVTHTAPYPDTL